jgi:hypothetical protein
MRTVKSEICSSEQFVSCSRDARLLFILLWTHCDDAGVHTDSPRRLKMELFPADDDATTDKVSEWLAELLKAGLVGRFESGQHQYLFVTGWQRHQKVRNPYYRFPKPPGWEGEHDISTDTEQHQCSTDTASVQHQYRAYTKETKTKETKRNESKEASDVDVDVDVGAHQISWAKVAKDKRKAIEIIGPPRNSSDESLVFKAAALAQHPLSEEFLWDSVDAVTAAYSRGSPPGKNRYAYFHGVLSSKAKDAGQNFKQLLKRVPNPNTFAGET